MHWVFAVAQRISAFKRRVIAQSATATFPIIGSSTLLERHLSRGAFGIRICRHALKHFSVLDQVASATFVGYALLRPFLHRLTALGQLGGGNLIIPGIVPLPRLCGFLCITLQRAFALASYTVPETRKPLVDDFPPCALIGRTLHRSSGQTASKAARVAGVSWRIWLRL